VSADWDRMDFLSHGVLALNGLPPDVRATWRHELLLAIEERGGLTGDRKHVDKAIAGEVFSEIIERGTRIFAKELTERTREYMSEDEIERLEVEIGNTLRKVLDLIASTWP
jgi:hypothetical protein